jgi:hypothetical protein
LLHGSSPRKSCPSYRFGRSVPANAAKIAANKLDPYNSKYSAHRREADHPEQVFYLGVHIKPLSLPRRELACHDHLQPATGEVLGLSEGHISSGQGVNNPFHVGNIFGGPKLKRQFLERFNCERQGF